MRRAININQVAAVLQDIFDEPLKDGGKRKIVFLVDKDKEFNEKMDQFVLEVIKVETLLENNQFHLKHLYGGLNQQAWKMKGNKSKT